VINEDIQTAKKIPKEHVLCTEYSDYGRSEISGLGITCLQEDIRESGFAEHAHRFDVVCMFQVLEHLDDLDTLFERLTWLTKEQAHLFITVPNAKHREFFERHGFLEDIPPTHIGRWSPLSLSIIAKRHGWTLAGHKTEPQSYAAKAAKFVLFKFDRSGHPDWMDQIRLRSIRRLAKLMPLGWCALTSLSALFALRSPELGLSQWFHLRKTGPAKTTDRAHLLDREI
jgi:SAM-dependent methyltransferase